MNKSESIAKIALALSKAQMEIKAALKDSENPFFHSSYAAMDSVVDAIKIPLSSNEISYSQLDGITNEGKPMLTTILMHSSGEWISGDTLLEPIVDAQKRKSAHTLLKRAALVAACGLAEKDDDGNASVEAKPEPKKEIKNYAPQSKSDVDKGADYVKEGKLVTEGQLKRLSYLKSQSCLSWEEITDYVKCSFNKTDSKTLNMVEYDKLCAFVMENPIKEKND